MLSRTRNLQVAILGRPNVGKSTLFNVLTRRRNSVVKNEAGVTRDILIQTTEWWGKSFDILDTGGLTESQDTFSKLIHEQVTAMVHHMDLLVLVMDGKSGLCVEDRDLFRIVKESQKPFILVVNKIDKMHEADLVLSEFFEFGEEVIPCSFEKRDNVDQVVERILTHVREQEESQEIDELSITVVGKPNVGKSSFCNKLLGTDRMLVSEIAGTTVDPVANQISYGGKPYKFVDTAGLRRASKREDGVEFISAIKSLDAMSKAEIILVMVDACEGPTEQDAKMVEKALDKSKAVILVANKLDLAQKEVEEARKTFREKTEQTFHFFRDIPIVFISALTGSGFDNLFQTIDELWEKLNIQISTSHLNKFFYETIRQAPAPVHGTKNVKFYYLTQTHQRPPSFIAFANYPKGVNPSYRRFLSKRIKEKWSLSGVPVRMFVMRSGS